MKDALFGGVNAAALTAMKPDLSPDLDRFAGHCNWLLANGCNGLGILGTTGEANSFGFNERKEILEGILARGVPATALMPGTGCGYLPSASACKGAGESFVSLSTLGANSCSWPSISSHVMMRPVWTAMRPIAVTRLASQAEHPRKKRG
mgnify:CR=1 FL=1